MNLAQDTVFSLLLGDDNSLLAHIRIMPAVLYGKAI